MAESDLCCGSAGIYNITQPAMSRRLMRRKAGNTVAVTPEIVVSGNPGCMIQLATGLRQAGAPEIKVRHLAEYCLTKPTAGPTARKCAAASPPIGSPRRRDCRRKQARHSVVLVRGVTACYH